MNTDRGQWHFTFTLGPIDKVTIEESHPDFDFVKNSSVARLACATLIDTSRFSLFKREYDQMDAILHSVDLPESRLIRVFRRVEHNITRSVSRRVPAFEYKDMADNTYFCFAFLDRVVITPNSRFYREGDQDD